MTHDPDAAFDAVIDAVSGRARPGQMMGRRTITVDRKLAACLSEGVLGIRLGKGTPAYAAAMGLPGASTFSPGDSGRLFADWVAIPVEQLEQWVPYVHLAIDRLTGNRTDPGLG